MTTVNNASPYRAGQVTFTSNVQINSVQHFARVVNPGDLTVALHRDSAGLPGAELFSAVVTLAAWLAVVLYHNWRPFDFALNPTRHTPLVEDVPPVFHQRVCWVPLADYYWNNKYQVFDLFVLKSLSFLPLGVLAAVWKGTGVDRAAQIVAVLGQSLPTFWIAIVLIEVVAGRLQWLPAGGIGGLARPSRRRPSLRYISVDCARMVLPSRNSSR